MKAWVDFKRRQKAIKFFDEVFSNEVNVNIIHYSCESFYKTGGASPRITSIAVKKFASGQVQSFSIHKIAEMRRIPFDQISDHYDELEKEMLEEFFRFVRENLTKYWVHWNMRDENYGFPALKRRFLILGGAGVPEIPDGKLFDLAHFFISVYGVSYIGHPRFEKLMQKNHVSDQNFLNGQQESDAWDSKEFLKLHLSTLRKIDVLYNFIKRYEDGTLQTESSKFAFT